MSVLCQSLHLDCLPASPLLSPVTIPYLILCLPPKSPSIPPFFSEVQGRAFREEGRTVTVIDFCLCFHSSCALCDLVFLQPGLIKMRTSVHFLCDTVLRTLLHVSPKRNFHWVALKHMLNKWTLSFTFMHLADAFIQSDLQLHSGYTFLLVHAFPGNRTHNLSLSWRNVLPLSHTGTHVFFLRRYRYILLCFYYVPTETYCGGSEFKYPGSVMDSNIR